MVGGGGAHLDREANARSERELVGVHPETESAPAPGPEDLPGGVGTEGTFFTKDVTPACPRGAGVKHGAGDEGDVFVLPPLVLGRHDMSPEIRDLFHRLPRHLEASRLVLDREAVARLRLERRRALSFGFPCQPRGCLAQRCLRGRAGGRDRGEYPAGRVPLPRHPRRELLDTVAGEDDVGVRVNEARDHAPACRVEDLVGSGRSPRRSDPGHGAVVDHEVDVAERAQHAPAELGPVGHEQPDPADEQRACRRSHPSRLSGPAREPQPRCRRPRRRDRGARRG